jgi:hypothetical protein
MVSKWCIVIVALTIVAATDFALAQSPPPRPVGSQIVTAPSQVRPPRIEIHPGSRPLLYRRCIDWYELQDRPSGTVLYPGKRCWWARG